MANMKKMIQEALKNIGSATSIDYQRSGRYLGIAIVYALLAIAYAIAEKDNPRFEA